MKSWVLVLQDAREPLLTLFVVLGALAGSLALVSPGKFKAVCLLGNRWVPTPFLTPIADKTIDTDRFLLRNCRLTGAFILVLTAVLALSVWIV